MKHLRKYNESNLPSSLKDRLYSTDNIPTFKEMLESFLVGKRVRIVLGHVDNNEWIEGDVTGFDKGDTSFDVLTYHGFSYPYYAGNISSLIKKNAMNCPVEIMKYLLKNRHLAPSHASTQYFPLEEDPLMIKKVPDIFVSAHTHKCEVNYYNNILIVSISCWEAMTPYQEKFGNEPDHCKVPMLNLKTREVKILDFESKEEDDGS